MQMVLFLDLHRAVPHLQHHPHDLVDPGARPQRAGQLDAGADAGSSPQPIEWLLYSDFAVVLAMVHLYTLFMVTPIFNTLMRIDRSLIEAARDAGASALQILWNVILPLAKPGMAIGTIFVVTLVMADFSTVQVMSGGQSASVALMMKNQMSLLQYPAAAANAVVLLVAGAADGRRRSSASSTSARSSEMAREKRTVGFYVLAAFFVLFVLFLYGPMSAIFILSFQGPNGGLTFPLNGVSLHWFGNLFERQAVGDFGASFSRSLMLGLMVMVATVVVALLAGLAFRRKFIGATPLFYLTIASLVVPSIIVVARHRRAVPADRHPAGLVRLGLRRAPDLDAAVRRPDHVRGLQPLLAELRGSGARSRRHRRGRPSTMCCCR